MSESEAMTWLLHLSAPNSYGYLPRTCRRPKTQTSSMDGGKFWRPTPYREANCWQLVAARRETPERWSLRGFPHAREWPHTCTHVSRPK